MQRRRWRINVDFPNCACWSCSASSLVPLCRVIVQQVKAYTVVCRPTEIKEKRLGLAGWWTNKIFYGCVGLQTASTDGLIPPFVCCCGFTRVWRSPLICCVVNTKEAKQTTWRCWLLAARVTTSTLQQTPLHCTPEKCLLLFISCVWL
jgi:hypothetical protein